MPLTDIAIRRAQPSSKSRKLFDGRGLYLEVTPRGGKYWRLKYRFGGKEKRLSLGVYPDVSLKEARRRCEDARRLLTEAIDPSEHRQAMKAARVQSASNSVEAVAREWFAKHAPNWAQSHSSRIISQLERDVFPWIGDKPVAAVTTYQLLAVVRRVEQRGALENCSSSASELWTGFSLRSCHRSSQARSFCGIARCIASCERRALRRPDRSQEDWPIAESPGRLRSVTHRALRLAVGPTGFRSPRGVAQSRMVGYRSGRDRMAFYRHQDRHFTSGSPFSASSRDSA